MSHCGRCDREVFPAQEMQPNGRIIDICPTCAGPVAAPTTEAEPAKSVAKVVALKVAPPQASTATTIVALAKARLAEVRAELAARRDLEAEAAILERIVWASEPANNAKAQ